MNTEKILVTAALPYANGRIHLGHISGAYLPSDIFVRYHRLKGSDILYICGSDEHGVPITISADNEKVSPKTIIDRYHSANREAFNRLGMSFDIYSRTSNTIHHETAKEFFLEFYNQGILKTKSTKQFYDEEVKKFLPDRYVEGTCPRCGFDGARSDECENCGNLYDPSELKSPVSKISGKTPVLKETQHWFFPLGQFQERLETYIKERSEKYGWKDNVLQYCNGWFKEGLTDRAITRDLDWGISVPLEGAVGKVLYVWFEAVFGYISATKELSIQRNDPELWKKYWMDPNTRYIPFIGKDNIVFHCIVFPAFLMAHNDGGEGEYVLPENVPANEFLNFEGKKFSKSRHWGIDVLEFLDLFPADSLRYALALNLPELRDTDFYWKDFQAKHNNELADILGNFVNRTLTFVFKHFEGKVPALYELHPNDSQMLNTLEEYPAKIGGLIEKYKIKDATLEMMNLARIANKYFNDSEPWKTIKSDRERCSTTLNVCIQTIFTLAEVFQPVLPFTSKKILNILRMEVVEWNLSGKINIQEGHNLGTPEILFKKIEDSEIDKMIESLGKPPEQERVPEEMVTIDDFMKIRLVVGEVLQAENVPKSEKLLKLQISTGESKRQVLAGIAKSYKPEELIGKRVIIVANLKPAKLMGMESQGMVLAVETNDGGLQVLTVSENVLPGTRAK